MTAKELIEKLQTVDPEMNVYFEDEDGRPIALTSLETQDIFQAYVGEDKVRRYHTTKAVVLCHN